MIRRFMLFLVAPLFAVTAQAGTKTLVSAPVMHEPGGIACTIGNAGPKTVTLTKGFLYGLVNQGSLFSEPFALEPGQFYTRFVPDTTVGFCTFTIEGSTKGVRAATCRWEGEEGAELGTSYDCVEAN